MKRLYQLAIVAACTALGAALGRYTLAPTVPFLARHLHLHFITGPSNHDLGDMVVVFMGLGYSYGLLFGILMTCAVLGGLSVGVLLARRIGDIANVRGLGVA